jgi:hypothetical protein
MRQNSHLLLTDVNIRETNHSIFSYATDKMFEMTRFICKYHVCWIAVFVELSPDEMGKLIGSGAFGKVRLVVDKESKQQYAMKIITKPVGEAARARAVDW